MTLPLLFTKEQCGDQACRKVTIFSQKESEDTSIATIVVRASTENVINDVERALDNGIRVVQALLQDPRLLQGAGAVELQLSKQLKAFATQTAVVTRDMCVAVALYR